MIETNKLNIQKTLAKKNEENESKNKKRESLCCVRMPISRFTSNPLRSPNPSSSSFFFFFNGVFMSV